MECHLCQGFNGLTTAAAGSSEVVYRNKILQWHVVFLIR